MTLPDGYSEVPAGRVAAVVTSLQMTARVPARAMAGPTPWTLRRVNRPALDWFRELYRRVGADWLWWSRLRLDDAGLAAIIHDPALEVHALTAQGRDEGLLELDFRIAGECELSFFGLTPALLGQGAGRWLMNRAIERAWSAPIRRFWVHTCSLDHPGALAFYLRSGFRAYRRQIEVAPDPRLDGILARDAAPQVPIL